MGIEDELTRELRGLADGVELDRVPAAGLARLGEQERRRRRRLAATGSVVAVCVAVVAGYSVSSVPGGDSVDSGPVVTPDSPAPTELPEGAATTVPWIKDGVLHVGDEEIETDLDTVRHAGDTTVVGTSPFAPESADRRWALVAGNELVELITTPDFVDLEISANGDTVAWAETSIPEAGGDIGETTATVTVYDVESQREVGSVESPPYLCCGGDAQFVFNGLDNQGRVFITVGEFERYVWMPGEDSFTEVTGTPEMSFSPGRTWPDGLTLSDGTIGTVDDQGGFESVAVVQGSPEWAPDGARYALARQAVDPVTEKRVRFDLPEGSAYRVLTWESPDAVILAQRDPDEPPARSLLGLVRCHADSGDCESVADGPTERAVLPHTN